MSCPEVIIVEENQKKSSSKATASLILGIISLVAWLLPLIGYPVSIVGLCLACCMMFGKKIKMNGIISDICSCMIMTIFTMILMMYFIPSLNMDIVIVSAIMPIVPGVAITNAIRDTLQGDYLSGCARILEAFLKAASIALGVGIGMAVLEMLIGGALLWL